MEKIEIFFKKEVEDFFNSLVFELFEKDYFSSLEYALEYKEKLISFIKNSINLFPAKKTPKKLKSFGSHYIFYKANQHTTWYIFFERFENKFLIKHITNNHSKETKYF